MPKVIDKGRYVSRLKAKITVLKTDLKSYREAEIYQECLFSTMKIKIYEDELALLERGDYDRE